MSDPVVHARCLCIELLGYRLGIGRCEVPERGDANRNQASSEDFSDSFDLGEIVWQRTGSDPKGGWFGLSWECERDQAISHQPEGAAQACQESGQFEEPLHTRELTRVIDALAAVAGPVRPATVVVHEPRGDGRVGVGVQNVGVAVACGGGSFRPVLREVLEQPRGS